MPMPSSCSSASSEGNVVTVTIRVPPSCGSNVKRIRIVGMSGTSLPSGPRKPSFTSNARGWSMLRNSQKPRDVSPFGPVIAYSDRPPTVKSWRSNFAGHSGGPQKRSI